MYTYKISGNDIIAKFDDGFDIAQTLDCGQAFRWEETIDGGYSGIALDKPLTLYQDENTVTFKNTTEKDFNNFWVNYFDFNTDYNKIKTELSKNDVLKKAIKFAGGIHILKQDKWEALCSFIISQNNNIPRIKGIISRLCEQYGQKVNDMYSFPSAKTLAVLEPEDLNNLRAGFRNKYIIDGARKTASGEIDFDRISSLPIDEARKELSVIKGVGPKVADCTLLFGFYRIEAFPRDVWIRRAMEVLFNNEFPKEAEKYAGIAQQYIFHYARVTKLDI